MLPIFVGNKRSHCRSDATFVSKIRSLRILGVEVDRPAVALVAKPKSDPRVCVRRFPVDEFIYGAGANRVRSRRRTRLRLRVAKRVGRKEEKIGSPFTGRAQENAVFRSETPRLGRTAPETGATPLTATERSHWRPGPKPRRHHGRRLLRRDTVIDVVIGPSKNEISL